jgi:hypothetical protein
VCCTSVWPIGMKKAPKVLNKYKLFQTCRSFNKQTDIKDNFYDSKHQNWPYSNINIVINTPNSRHKTFKPFFLKEGHCVKQTPNSRVITPKPTLLLKEGHPLEQTPNKHPNQE